MVEASLRNQEKECIRKSTIDTFGEEFIEQLHAMISKGRVIGRHKLGLVTVSSDIYITISQAKLDLIKEYLSKWRDHEVQLFLYDELKCPNLSLYRIDCSDFYYKMNSLQEFRRFEMIHLVFVLWPFFLIDYINRCRLLKNNKVCVNFTVTYSMS